MNRLIFLFLDGVGIGDRRSSNPFADESIRYMPFYYGGLQLPDGTPVIPLDNRCGIDGLPQSATCQTALFTGTYGKSLGESHIRGYPNRTLRRIIVRHNLLSSMSRKNQNARFINAYPQGAHFFTSDTVSLQEDGSFRFSKEFPWQWKRMISVTTCMLLASGQVPFGEDHIRSKQALYQDFSNQILIRKGNHLPLFSPIEAAEILFEASRRYTFILYEYFQTDVYAHRYPEKECRNLLASLDQLIGHLLFRLNPDHDTLILTSDHGNLEDLSHRHHTLNPVPLVVWGKGQKKLAEKIHRLSDVTPAILEWATES